MAPKKGMFDWEGYWNNEQGMFPDLYGQSTTQSVKDITGAGPNEGLINDRVPFIGTKDKALNTLKHGVPAAITGGASLPFTVGHDLYKDGEIGAWDTDASLSRNIQTQHDDLTDFDMNNPNEVKALQRRLGVKDDGIFGPITEKAYRTAVNKERTAGGQDPYVYQDDSLASMAMNNEQQPGAPAEELGETVPTKRELRIMDRQMNRRQRQADRKERQRARKEARYDRRFSRAEERALDDKHVWNKNFRNILNDQAEQEQSWDTNPYRKPEQYNAPPPAPAQAVDYSGESVEENPRDFDSSWEPTYPQEDGSALYK